MSQTVEIGQAVDNGAVHIKVRRSRCATVTRYGIQTTVSPADVSTANLCGHCGTEANLAAVERANTMGSRSSVAVERMLERLATTEAQTRSAELVARYHAAQPVEAVKPLSNLGVAAARIGAHTVHTARRTKASKRTANAHNLFIVKAA
jgi:hypothetical protein